MNGTPQQDGSGGAPPRGQMPPRGPPMHQGQQQNQYQQQPQQFGMMPPRTNSAGSHPHSPAMGPGMAMPRPMMYQPQFYPPYNAQGMNPGFAPMQNQFAQYTTPFGAPMYPGTSTYKGAPAYTGPPRGSAPAPPAPAPAPREKRVLLVQDPNTKEAVALPEAPKPKPAPPAPAAPVAAAPAPAPAKPVEPVPAAPAVKKPNPFLEAVQAQFKKEGEAARKAAPEASAAAEVKSIPQPQKPQQPPKQPAPSAAAAPQPSAEDAAARQRREAESKAKLEAQERDAAARRAEVQAETERDERKRREAELKQASEDAEAAQRKAQEDARREQERAAAAKARELSSSRAPPQQQQQPVASTPAARSAGNGAQPSGPLPTVSTELAGNGKLMYSASDLRLFKAYCLAIPDALTDVNFDVVAVPGGAPAPRGPPQRRPDQGGRSGRQQQQPSWERNASRAQPAAGGARGGGGRGGPPPMSVGLDVAPLAMSENRYQPKQAASELEATDKKIKGVLNKLTLEKFDRLSRQIVEIPMSSVKMLDVLMAAIFEKALTEPKFGELYADLCRVIVDETADKSWGFIEIVEREDKTFAFTASADESEPDETRLVGAYPTQEKAREEAKKLTDFKRILLNKCQEEFEKEASIATADEEVESVKQQLAEAEGAEAQAALKAQLQDATYERLKIKRKVLGNVQFIGELYKKGILTEKVIHYCIVKILKPAEADLPEEEDLECLCRLLTTIGATIDASHAPETRSLVDKYFAKMKLLAANKDVDARFRFLVKDVIDMRDNKWQARREELKVKTIEQVHKDAEREEREKARGGGGGGGYRGGGGGGRGGGRQGGRPDPRNSNSRGGPGAPVMPTVNRQSAFGGGSKIGGGAGKVGGPKTVGGAAGRSTGGGAAAAGGPPARQGGAMRPGGNAAPVSFRPGATSTRPTPQIAAPNKSAGPGGRVANLNRANSNSSAPSPAPSSGGGAKIDDATMHNKVNGALMEYVDLQMASELVESMRELLPQVVSADALKRHVVAHGAAMMVDKKDAERRHVPDALVILATQMELLTRDDFVGALADKLEFVGDEMMDSPLCAQYYGQLVAHLVVHGQLQLADLEPITAKAAEETPHHVPALVKKVLAALKASEEGAAALQAQKDSLPAAFVEQHKLQEALQE